MKVSSMRRMDAWVGIPLCFLATLAEKLAGWFGRRTGEPGERLLIVKLSEMGAVVLLEKPIESLRRTYSRDKMWFLAFEESRPIIEVMDFFPLENMIFISTKSLAAFAVTAFMAMVRIWRLRPDTVLDLEFFSRASALIIWLTGARRRVGLYNYFGEGPWRGELMTHGVKFNPHLHISQMFMVLTEAVTMPVGVLQRIEYVPPPPEPLKTRFKPTGEELKQVDRILREAGWIEGERIVLLNANTSDRELIPLRRWKEENYAELGRSLLREFPDMRLLLTGAPKEAGAVVEIERSIDSDRCRSVAGRTTMRELLGLYQRSALMVTNDSGPGHFAAIAGLPVIVLFGPETPLLWKPLGEQVDVVYRGLACSPCFSACNGRQSGCHRNACMDMTPEEVFLAAHRMLQSTAPIL